MFEQSLDLLQKKSIYGENKNKHMQQHCGKKVWCLQGSVSVSISLQKFHGNIIKNHQNLSELYISHPIPDQLKRK